MPATLNDTQRELIIRYIFTGWARCVLEYDLVKVNVSPFKFPVIYRDVIENALNRLAVYKC